MIMKLQKTLLTAAMTGTVFLAAAEMFAFGESDLAETSDFGGAQTPAGTESAWASSVGVEAFYACGNKKMMSDDLDEVDIGGVSLRYSVANTSKSLIAGTRIFPEFYGILSIGGGSLDQTIYYYGGRVEWNYDVFTVQAAVGANLRCFVTDAFSVFGGVRLGVAYEDVEIEEYATGYGSYTESESDIGLLYGIGVGAEWNFKDRHSLTFGLDYVASTAQPEFDDFELDKQSYVVFSVGYKYRF